MTDTINTIVTGLQGFPVSNSTPNDGYVLTWSQADGYWVARPATKQGLRKVYCTESGTWTCPEGVTNVLIIAAGGGGGGQAARSGSEANIGGGGSIQQICYLSVTPGLIYDIIIGSGGSGGIGHGGTGPGLVGSSGNSTSFSYSSNILFSAIGAAGGGSSSNASGGNNINVDGGLNNTGLQSIRNFTKFVAATGGVYSDTVSMSGDYGNPNYINTYDPGSPGTPSGSNRSGSGGGAGPQGNGGNGGNASTGNGFNGDNAPANSGAGGGSGGNGAPGFSGGNGGNGGSGYMHIIY